MEANLKEPIQSELPPPYSATTVEYHSPNTPDYLDCTSSVSSTPSNQHQDIDSSSLTSEQQRNSAQASTLPSCPQLDDLPNYIPQPKQRFSMQTISQNFQYNPRKGLIGNTFGLVGSIVATATHSGYSDTRNRPGDVPVHTTAFSRSNYTPTTPSTSGSSLSAVVDFLVTRREEKEMRRLARREARHERMEMKRERRELKRAERKGDRGVKGLVESDQQTTGVLNVVKQHGHIEMDQSFMGDECHLETSNGHIQVHGSLSASNHIDFRTANGNITVDGQLSAGEDIHVSSNGTFAVNGNSIVARRIIVNTTQCPLNFNSFIESDIVQLSTKNAPIMLSQVSIGSELIAQTSNAATEVHIEDIGSGNAIIQIETDNAPVNVYLPRNFAGRFNIKTSDGNQANIVAKRGDAIQFGINDMHEKEGVCYNMGNQSNVQVHIRTSNAPATLYI